MQAERYLNGQWKLVYTSNSELFGLLGLSKLPFVTIGDITQNIQASTLTVENKVIPVPHTACCMAQHAMKGRHARMHGIAQARWAQMEA